LSATKLEAAQLAERHLAHMVAPQLLAQDILAPGLLKDTLVLVAGHAPVHHPHGPAQLPVVQILLHLRDTLAVVLVAGQHPAAHREALAGHRQTHGHQRQIIALVLGLAVSLQLGGPRLMDLKVSVGGVEEDQIHRQVQKACRGPEHFFLDGLGMLQQKNSIAR
jgi:hypothetical protein